MSKRPAGHRKKERPVGRRTTEPIGKQPAEHHKMERQPEPHRQERPAAGHRKMARQAEQSTTTGRTTGRPAGRRTTKLLAPHKRRLPC